MLNNTLSIKVLGRSLKDSTDRRQQRGRNPGDWGIRRLLTNQEKVISERNIVVEVLFSARRRRRLIVFLARRRGTLASARRSAPHAPAAAAGRPPSICMLSAMISVVYRSLPCLSCHLRVCSFPSMKTCDLCAGTPRRSRPAGRTRRCCAIRCAPVLRRSLVLPGLARRHADVGDRHPAGHLTGLGIAAQIADQNHFVDSARHGLPLLSSHIVHGPAAPITGQ